MVLSSNKHRKTTVTQVISQVSYHKSAIDPSKSPYLCWFFFSEGVLSFPPTLVASQESEDGSESGEEWSSRMVIIMGYECGINVPILIFICI